MIAAGLLVLLCLCTLLTAKEVSHIPNYKGKPITFKNYADIVEVNKDHGRFLYYFFSEAQSNPATAPLILWTNGGPGCSSMLGAFSENGPFIIEKDGTVVPNDVSWNAFANVIFLEHPAGVGYSYSNTPEDYKTCNDNRTAADAYAFLEKFFVEFPQFKDNELYIAGESYGGHYVPIISYEIHVRNQKVTPDQRMNLKGMLVGNGCTHLKYDTNSLPTFLWQHSVISDIAYRQGLDVCKNDFYKHQQEPACTKAMNGFYEQITDINIYDLYGYCEHSDSKLPNLATAMKNLRRVGNKRLHPLVTVANSLGSNGDIPCFDFSNMVKYFNDPNVREVLHAPDNKRQWTPCSMEINQYYDWTFESMLFVYEEFLHKYRVLVYSGDVDAAVNSLGTQTSLMQLRANISMPWQSWTSEDRQIGGKKFSFDGGLQFYTVRGAGHMVPDKKESYKIFSGFFNGHLP